MENAQNIMLNLERQNIKLRMFHPTNFVTFHRDTHPQCVHRHVHISTQNKELEEMVQNIHSAFISQW